jgi:hypothetical protein
MAGKLRDGLAVCLSDDQCESLRQLLKEDVKLRIKTGILSQVNVNLSFNISTNFMITFKMFF